MIRELLGDGTVPAGILILLLLLAASIWHLSTTRRKSRAAAHWLVQNAPGILRDESKPAPPRGVAAEAMQELRSALVGRHGEALVLDRPLRDVLEPTFDAYLERGFGAAMGNAFTGVALIVTFLLIAIVLFKDVGPAIQHSMEENGNSQALLAHSVGLMGGKFLISCLGIGLALVHQMILSRYRDAVASSVVEAATALRPAFVAISAVRMENEAATLAAVKGLQRIEVSVKDLGQEVSDRLRGILTDALARQIEQLLADMKVQSEELQNFLREFLERQMRLATEQILTELRATHETLKTQAGTQIEQLLTKLQDAVSGTFSSESRNISTQLAQFATVFPNMATQLSGVASRMESMLLQLEKQQAATGHIVDQVAEASRDHVVSFGEEFSKAGTAAMQRVFGETSEQLNALVGGLQAATSLHATSTDRIRENMAGTIAEIEKSLNVVHQTSGTLQDLMKEVANAAAAIGAQTNGLAAAAQGVAGSSRSMIEVTNKLQQLERDTVAALETEAKRQALQQQLMEQMQNVWPTLLATVAQRVAESTRALDETWARTGETFQKAVASAGQGFSASVEELAETVKDIRSAQTPSRLQAGR